MTSDAHPHHPLLRYPESGSQVGPNPTATEPHPESSRQGCPGESLRTQEMQYTPPHTQQHRHALHTHTNPEALDTPRCKEAEPQQLRDTQTWTHGRCREVPHCGPGRDPQTHKERCRDRDTKGHVYEGEARDTNAQKSCKCHTHCRTRAPGKAAMTAQVVYEPDLTGRYPSTGTQQPASIPSQGPEPGSREVPSLEVNSPTHLWSGCSEGIPSAVSVPPARQEPGAWGPWGPPRSS